MSVYLKIFARFRKKLIDFILKNRIIYPVIGQGPVKSFKRIRANVMK